MESFSINKADLHPILPSTIRDSGRRDTRYSLTSSNMPVPLTIDPLGANLESVLPNQSQGWTASAHTEGKRYAHTRQAGITIVTEANIAEPEVLDQLNAWLAVICNTNNEQVHLLDNSDLFLELHQDASACNYYFVDHDLRTVFWLHTLNPSSVGLSTPYSDSYLQYSPEENYWIHVELFPGTSSPYSAKALHELQVVFSHACSDIPTSKTLTFPYTVKECEEFIDLLECSKGHASSPPVVICVARLWATVAYHRFIIHPSEVPKHCQLSNQATLEIPENRGGLVLVVISKMLLFGFPDRYEARFKSFLVDQLIDPSCWRQHASETVEDWKQTMSSIMALLGASTLTSSSSDLIKASSFLCAFDLATTSFLLQRQQRLLCMNIPTSVAYLKRFNISYGLQPIAIVHSLPQALFVWALLLFSMQGFWAAFVDLPVTLRLSTLLPVASILATVGLGIWFIAYPRPEPPLPRNPTNERQTVDCMV